MGTYDDIRGENMRDTSLFVRYQHVCFSFYEDVDEERVNTAFRQPMDKRTELLKNLGPNVIGIDLIYYLIQTTQYKNYFSQIVYQLLKYIRL